MNYLNVITSCGQDRYVSNDGRVYEVVSGWKTIRLFFTLWMLSGGISSMAWLSSLFFF